MAELYQLCTEKNYIYSNWYSDTYRASLSVDSVTGIWDIRHISIPFDSVKEHAFMVRNSLTMEQMTQFYRSFAAEIKRSLEMETQIKDSKNQSAASVSMLRVGVSVKKKAYGPGSDIYCVYEPSMPFISGGYLSDSGASLTSILNTGIYLAGALQAYSASGITISSFDISSLYIREDSSGRKSVRNGFILTGGTDSVKNALVSICSALYSMLDGHHYLTPPDLSKAPAYADEQLHAALLQYIKGESSDLHAFKDYLMASAKALPDRYISFTPPAWGNVDYTPPLHVGDTVCEEESDGSGSDEDKEPADTPLRVKAAVTIAAAICAAALIIFVTLPMAGINLFEPKVTECPHIHSSENGVYVLSGSVVDTSGSVIAEYILDSEGNIWDESGTELIYPCEYADPWPAAETIEMTVLSKSFVTFPSVSDLYLCNGVHDLRSFGCIYDETTRILKIPVGYHTSASQSGTISEGDFAIISQSGADIPLVIGKKSEGTDNRYDVYTISDDSPEASDIYYGTANLIENALSHDAEASAYMSRYLGGQWTYVCMVKASPQNILDQAVEIRTESPFAFFRGENDENVDTVTVELDDGRCGFFILVINVHGSIAISCKSMPGGFSTLLTENVPEGTRNLDIPAPPADTAVPAPSPSPQPSATVGQTYTSPVTYAPAETPYTPQETESPVFGVSVQSLSIQTGQSESVTTTGNDCGYISVYSDDTSVAVVDISGGIDGCYTVTAIGTGTCNIIFATGESILRIAVTVT